MLRYSFVTLFVILTSLTAIVSPSPASMTSSSYEISSSVISGGGSKMTSANYTLISTLGQPSPLGLTTSANFELRSGFWESASRLTMRKMGLTPAIYLLLLGD